MFYATGILLRNFRFHTNENKGFFYHAIPFIYLFCCLLAMLCKNEVLMLVHHQKTTLFKGTDRAAHAGSCYLQVFRNIR